MDKEELTTKKALIIILILSALFITGCKKDVDYSKYKFTDIRWTTEDDRETEYLRFESKGTHTHYCACGNPINNSDICDGYTYNEKTKTIELKCDSKYSKTKIKKLKSTYDILILDFEGEKKSMKKNYHHRFKYRELKRHNN